MARVEPRAVAVTVTVMPVPRTGYRVGGSGVHKGRRLAERFPPP